MDSQEKREALKQRLKQAGPKEILEVPLSWAQRGEMTLHVAPGGEVLGVGISTTLESPVLFILEDTSLEEIQEVRIAVRGTGEDCSDLLPYQYLGTVQAWHSPSGDPDDAEVQSLHVFNRSK